jgi:ABC-type transport system involved in multi-copper enzyme maturation permease subunit
MFGKIAGFELRYQLKSPVFWVVAVIFFLLTFGVTTISQISIGLGPSDHRNGPYALAQSHLIFSLFYMFVTTAFVSNVVVRDDETGFGPILRATRLTKFDYLYGRFLGAFAAAAISFLAVPLAVFLGSMMPWVDSELLGPNRLESYLFAYFVLALPSLLLTSAMFFALATVTRSMMWTYVGVIAFMVIWIVANIALGKPEFEQAAALWEPLGTAAYGLVTKYWTASERNTLIPPLAGALLFNRALALVASAGFLVAGLRPVPLPIGRALGRAGRQAQDRRRRRGRGAPAARDPRVPRFDAAWAWAQLAARTRLDMGQVFKSPAYFVLLALGLVNAPAPCGSPPTHGSYGGSIRPLTRVLLQPLAGSFGLIPMIIAIYYAGELVWRERDRKTHEIIDAAPVADWAFVAPKVAAISLVLLSTLAVSVLAAIVSQLAHGYTNSSSTSTCSGTCCPRRSTWCCWPCWRCSCRRSPPQVHRLGPDGDLHRHHPDLREPRLRAQSLQLRRGHRRPDFRPQPPGQVLDRRLVVPALLDRLRGGPGGADLRPLATRDRDPALAAPAPPAQPPDRQGRPDLRRSPRRCSSPSAASSTSTPMSGTSTAPASTTRSGRPTTRRPCCASRTRRSRRSRR